MFKLISSLALLLSLQVAQSDPTEIRCADEVCFSTSAQLNGERLELSGIGELDYWLFDVYVAGLYTRAGAGTVVEQDVPTRLELSYQRSISRKDIIRAADKFFKKSKQHSRSDYASELARINKAYRDVREDDRYALVYEPGKGTTLEFNGAPQVTIPGWRFARAYFSIWLSDHALDRDLCADLLRRKC